MESIARFLADDHRRCDALYAEAESAVADARWDAAAEAFARFREGLLHHFAMEEQTLFPAYEAASGQAFGPTAVMRIEHAQMRDLLDGMARATQARDRQACLGIADTLLVLMQQHNFKEERVLYPMTDSALGPEAEALLERMRGVATA